MKDTYRHKGLRKKLVDQLRLKGIDNEKLLEAMTVIPRHIFLDSAFEELAYEDKALPIDNDQTISQPYTVANQTLLIDPKPGDKILEVGTGSGYQAAILALMGAEVFTLERQEILFLKAKTLLTQLGIEKVRFFLGDGYEGLLKHSPFDKIIVTAGAPEVLQTLCNQLKIGGILVIPVGQQVQRMLKITRTGENTFQQEDKGDYRFVPLLPGVVRKGK